MVKVIKPNYQEEIVTGIQWGKIKGGTHEGCLRVPSDTTIHYGKSNF